MSTRNDSENSGATAASGSSDESGVDTRRYLAALRRSRWLIAIIVVTVTVLVVALSLVTAKSYEATATIRSEPQTIDLLGSSDEDLARSLATDAKLITRFGVLAAVAEDFPPLTVDDLESKVSSEVDPEANLIYVTVSDGDPEMAAALATAIADSFIKIETREARRQLDTRIAELEDQVAPLDPQDSRAIQINKTIDDLEITADNIEVGLDLAEQAVAPETPASPRPLRNGILALFFAVFVGVLVALGRDQLRPSVGNPRELARLTRMSVLAGIPFVHSRGRQRHHDAAIEHESYQSLGAAVQIALPPSGQHVVMITSALHGEGKTTATARLGRVLAEAGHKTLLVSGDLRFPALHDGFGLPVEPGFSDMLNYIQRSGVSRHLLPATLHSVPLQRDSSGRPRSLDVLTSGSQVPDPATLLSGEALGPFLDHVRSFPYSYVLIDGPPMLGIADGQALAQRADRVIVVSRLERLTIENVVDLRELLDRLEAAPLGQVVIGARVEVSPYYQSERSRHIASGDRGEDGGEAPAYDGSAYDERLTNEAEWTVGEDWAGADSEEPEAGLDPTGYAGRDAGD